MPHAARRATDTCLRLSRALGLRQPPAFYKCDSLYWGPGRGDNTGGLFSLFIIHSAKFGGSYSISAPACWHFSFGHCKGFASGTAKIILTGAPGAPGGPKIASPFWKDIFILRLDIWQYGSNAFLFFFYCRWDWRRCVARWMDDNGRHTVFTCRLYRLLIPLPST